MVTLLSNRAGKKDESFAVEISVAPHFINGKLLGVQILQNSSGKVQSESTHDLRSGMAG